ncbi:uncharacterized protein TRUGW13939_05085 [Talaromyces rugulosus]|uniref:Rhodopsin domain-containing protein n=1 Tax=Talaromyces rugulosus TaxID=121627 RepID=A0A7H8QWS9_TALRU|nr:uncharacterized protein TRUGW13939_05085 [Talaromyces rugulosus]QKX57965.1 hypothetical protein TRUGW13939_05085 [Talaromyces rugulosus]
MGEPSSPQDSSGYLAESRQDAVRGVAAIFIALDTIVIAMRFTSKRIGSVKFGWDDAWITCGYLFSIAIIACSLVDVDAAGLGLHEDRVFMMNPEDIVLWAKLTLIVAILYQLAVVSSKMGVLLLYLHIFDRRQLRFVCYAIACIVVLNCVSSIIAVLLICIPLHAFWDHSPNANCVDTNSLFRWTSFANIVTDVVMLVLPVPAIFKMTSSISVKLGIFTTLGMGSVGLVFSILRFAEFFTVDAVVDVTWSGTNLVIWTMIESSIYSIAACLVACRPLARYLWKKTPFGTSIDDVEMQPSARRTFTNSDHQDYRPRPLSGFYGLDSEVDDVYVGEATSKDVRRSVNTTDTHHRVEIGETI